MKRLVLIIRQLMVSVLPAMVMLSLLGCSGDHRPDNLGADPEPMVTGPLQVVPVTMDNAIMLNVDDIIQLMRASGFDDQQIYDIGTHLREALLASGGAKILAGRGKPVAMFKVQGDMVWGMSKSGASFVYDVKSSQFGQAPRPQSIPPIGTYRR